MFETNKKIIRKAFEGIMGQLKYRRKVYCRNCGINQDLEFDYKEKISSAMCPLCGCETLELEQTGGEDES